MIYSCEHSDSSKATMVKFRVIFRSLVYMCIPILLPAAGSDGTVRCSTDSRGFSDDIFTVTCPAGCSTYQYNRRVWGTGVYTSDSSICRAAIHDGRITNDGGQVTVYRWPGQDSYQGSERNGIQTDAYGSWPGSFAFIPVCRDALGMEDGTIEDGDITASSTYGTSWSPSDARLNGARAWRPFKRTGSWIQVDLKQPKTVSGVITQGFDVVLNWAWNDYWITSYQVQYQDTSGSWATIMDQTGNEMYFPGNTDANGKKTNWFHNPVLAKVIRLYPLYWNRQPALRMELLGCDIIASTTESTPVPRTTSTVPHIPSPTYTFRPTEEPFASVAPKVTTRPTTAAPDRSSTDFSTAFFDGDHEQQKGQRDSLSVGAIAGIAAGTSVVLIVLLVSLVIFLRKRQSSNEGASNVPRNPPEQRFRNPEYSDVTAANEHTAPAQDEGYTDCELYNTEDNNPYEPYNYANSGQISGGEISQPSHDYDYATIPGESDRGVVDNVIYETSDMT